MCASVSTVSVYVYISHWFSVQMERSPLISWAFHLRVITLLLILGGLDYIFMRSAWKSIATKGLSVEIVFGLEVRHKHTPLSLTHSLTHTCAHVYICYTFLVLFKD